MQGHDQRLSSIFIVPLVQAIVGLFLFVALLHGQWDLTILAILVLSVVIGANLWSRASLSGVRCSYGVDKSRAFPGEEISLKILVVNAKVIPVWLQMSIPLVDSLKPSSGETSFTGESGLLGYQRARFQWELIAQRRGVHRVGPPHLRVGDLFGFFPRQREEKSSLQVIVYPRLVPLNPLTLPRRDLFGIPGAKSPFQDPVYILGTMDYQHWRPAKYIHWKASARHNRLQEKVFEPTEQEKVLLLVDVNQFVRNKATEAFERVLEVVASLAVRLDRQGHAVGVVTNGAVDGGGSRILPIEQNPHQLPEVLELLARLQMEPQGDLVDMLRRGLELTWGMSCVYFTFQEDEVTKAIEEDFSHHGIPVVCVVAEGQPLQGGGARRAQGSRYCIDDIHMGGAERT
jgi:uncharacterized protein (DUF58 family)